MNVSLVLTAFFDAIAEDRRISSTHIGIFAALVHFGQIRGSDGSVQAFSYEIMNHAKISSTNTYHKCIRDLSAYGYLRYEPSFKRNQGSMIFFVCPDKEHAVVE
ncbi:hypothetical protein [Olivibacter domesticus]|nr:hypothetical protein [Olivibacter domesticus]